FEGDNPQAVMMKRVMSEPVRLRTVAPSVSEAVEAAVMSGLERNRNERTPTVEAFAEELSRVTYSGTQMMGGVVTGQLGPQGEGGRETTQWSGGGAQTKIETGPAFTGQSEVGSPTVPSETPNKWAPTEVTPVPPPPTHAKRPETAPPQPEIPPTV